MATAIKGRTRLAPTRAKDDDPDYLRASEVDPADVAKWFLRENSVDNVPLIRHWGGDWWGWQAGCWRRLAKQHVESMLLKSMQSEYTHVKRTHVSNAMMHFQAMVHLPDGQSPPCWAIGNAWELYRWQLKDCLFTQNSIVYLPEFSLGGRQRSNVQRATPKLFNTVGADYDFARRARNPTRWFKFLRQLWPDDNESITALQMMFGYLLTPDTSHHKIFALIGPKRSGKGTIMRVLRKLVGEGNVAGPTLGELGNEFALQGLLDKTLAIISDLRMADRCPPRAIERLLAISGEDKHTINVKHAAPIDAQLPIRFLLASNELPKLPDSSKAVISRLIVLRTSQSFYPKSRVSLQLVPTGPIVALRRTDRRRERPPPAGIWLSREANFR
jgi:putative DNA primase/helicase